MNVSGGAESILPSLLVDDARARDERAFLLLYGDAAILLIRIPPGAADLQHGLEASEAGTGRIPFRTEAQTGSHARAASRLTDRPRDPGSSSASSPGWHTSPSLCASGATTRPSRSIA